MADFRVAWEIDVEAETPRQAAEEALKIQRDPDSVATVFEVFGPNYNPPSPCNVEVIDLGRNASQHWRQADMDAHAWKELGERLLAWYESLGGWEATVWDELRNAVRGQAQPAGEYDED